MAACAAGHQLTTIPARHFLTGRFPPLRAAWNACQIEIAAPGREAGFIRTSQICLAGLPAGNATPASRWTITPPKALPASLAGDLNSLGTRRSPGNPSHRRLARRRWRTQIDRARISALVYGYTEAIYAVS